MQVLIYTKKQDYIKVIGLLCDDIHASIDVDATSACQLANTALSDRVDLVIIDDRLYEDLTNECIALLEEHQIKLIVLLKKKNEISKYLSMNLVDYFVSPLSWEDIRASIKSVYKELRVLRNLVKDEGHDKIVVKTSSEIYFVPFKEILYLEKANKETIIHTKAQHIECHESLKKLGSRLPDSFIRVHSSYIVNFTNAKHIIDIGNRTYHISFDDYMEYAIMSRKKSEQLLDHAINHYRLSFIEDTKKGK